MKLGILTHYYNSTNYGGVLQAYALCKYLNSYDIDTEQISLQLKKPIENDNKNTFFKIIKKVIKGILKQFIFNGLKKRETVFSEFRETIPHSQTIFDDSNIYKCIDNYNGFIVGSDQVWNMDWFQKPFFLNFVPDDKLKFSYAASLGMNELNKKDTKYFISSLNRFNAISVRENEAYRLLTTYIDKPIEIVLDPVFLLSQNDWAAFSEKYTIHQPYIFCYYLTSNEAERKAAALFAKRKGLKIITLPHLQNQFVPSDLKFGDYSLYDVSPQQFLGLINNAEYIFTDSFHAVAFSLIFKKQFFVFHRNSAPGMNDRINTVLELFNCQNRFFSEINEDIINLFLNLQNINYNNSFPLFTEMLAKSQSYIEDIITEVKNEA